MLNNMNETVQTSRSLKRNLQVGSQNCRGNGLIYFTKTEADKNRHCVLKKSSLARFFTDKYQ